MAFPLCCPNHDLCCPSHEFTCSVCCGEAAPALLRAATRDDGGLGCPVLGGLLAFAIACQPVTTSDAEYALVLGAGGVDSEGRIECATDGQSDFGSCATTYLAHSVVILRPRLAVGSYRFLGWGGACEGAQEICIMRMDSAKNITAFFETSPPALSLDFGLKQLRFRWEAVPKARSYRILQAHDSIFGFTPAGTLTFDAEVAVHHHNWQDAQYRLQACDDLSCITSEPVATLGGMFRTIGYLKASNTDTEDRFGSSVALSADGTTLAIAAELEDSNDRGVGGDQSNNDAVNSGAVYIFVRGEDGWTQEEYIKASNTNADDHFGSSVALSADGKTLAIGARREASNARKVGGAQSSNHAAGSGAVYIFVRGEDGWTQEEYIKASNADVFDWFGSLVSLSGDGNTLAVGAWAESNNTRGVGGREENNHATRSGAVYIFVRGEDGWTQEEYIKASNTDAFDRFGVSVALSASGKILAVGADGEGSRARGIGGNQGNNDMPRSGAVYIFVREDNDWTQEAYLKASNTDTGDSFGASVTLSADGNTLAVGASREGSSARGVGGSQNNNDAIDSGAVYTFVREANGWTQEAYLKASNTGAEDRFGISVALDDDGNTLAVGAWGEGSSARGVGGNTNNNNSVFSGAVYVFARQDNSWTQGTYLKASNTNAGDLFGSSVSLSADGNTLAVASLFEASNTRGIGGAQNNNDAPVSGAVYLY